MSRPCLIALALLLGAALPGTCAAGDDASAPATYNVRQTVSLSAIDEKAKDIQWWVAIPDDSRHQDLLDFTVVSAPGPWQIVREAENGNRFLYVEARNPGKAALDVVVDFTLRREAVKTTVDPSLVGAISPADRAFYAASLVRDEPNMEVTADVERLAKEACGDESNLALQAAKLLDKVAQLADHYSKDATKPKCGIGSAKDCLTNGGGCCTDLHSLFIAMARSRGIPARLQMGYRMLPKNLGKEVDPGYRCWAEYFLPGYGWVSADIVEADAPDGLGAAVWFTGLTVHRLWLNEGRNFVLPLKKSAGRVNHMSIAYAEIDGRAARVLPEGDLAPQLTRKVKFETVAAPAAAVGMAEQK
jgi:transglutaminase-like putative cysteine protease